MGAVAFFAAGGGTGVTLLVTGVTGAVPSRGWVTPAPGLARSVIRTVSFFSGTAEVFGEVGTWGGVGGFSGSLMTDGSGKQVGNQRIGILYLPVWQVGSQCLSLPAANLRAGAHNAVGWGQTLGGFCA